MNPHIVITETIDNIPIVSGHHTNSAIGIRLTWQGNEENLFQ